MRNKDLAANIQLPLKVVTIRLEHIKSNLPGLMKRVEWYALDRQKREDRHECLISADEWTFAALDCLDSKWRDRLKVRYRNKPELTNPEIPLDFINKLPCDIGEILTLGSWSLTKNIFRFEDQVIQMLVKTEYKKGLPSFLLNIPDIAVYIQTDNANLKVKNELVVGVIFSKSTLNGRKVLFTTIYTDTGLSKTVTMFVPEDDDYETTVDDCLADFLDTFLDENDRPSEEEVRIYTDLQKKLINLIIWFSQKEPDFKRLTDDPIENTPKLTTVKRELRLFEASKYKPTIVGIATNKRINAAIKERDEDIRQGKYVGTRIPHPRMPHWHFYWMGKRGAKEKWVNHWIPFLIVGGVPTSKEK
ncbi:TPA: hypothetical protein MW242_002615 [Acinetobacter baumannii]|nr:hypothetical protein [Acinetobacter baumannii]